MSEKDIEIGVLYDILQLNEERARNYNRAIENLHSDDADLKAIFAGMSQQSTHYKQALSQLLQQLLQRMSTESSRDLKAGEIFKTWLDAKKSFTGHDRQAVLTTCEHGEKAINRAYEMALDTDNLSVTLKSLLESQQTELRAALDHIAVLKTSIS